MPAQTVATVIVAAGRGLRAGGGVPKQWRDLAGRPVLARTLDAFAGLGPVCLVLHPDDIGRAPEIEARAEMIVPGGADRAASVRAGLEALAATSPGKVLIHDAARPLVMAETIEAVIAALDHHPAAAPGLAITDALWRVADGHVGGTVPREGLVRAQTPQGFRFDSILAAHRRYEGPSAADDVAVAQAAGLDVALVPGHEDNMKITGPGDFARAARILGTDMDVRTGNGFDVHAFGPGDHVWLCGVKVEHGQGLVGHSDADVGMHALTDAIYGAMAHGDIGQHFPPSDPEWKGARSEVFLAHAADLARVEGFAVTHCDVTLICERPKIGPHAQAMREELARIMQIEPARVSVKATTSERLGFTGREEGIAAIATATLVKS
ncbi:bifunctional 2-C-methyl-D-erythritol 4-phosphate cytidylyltransferase/2-C-methyl-D-erythritol 2,4-cyclodiphosphate synthase [Limimaricola pyoseonensis]|uniref:Bifunctional enzyme IspD/IspF n=1 Tax=Limimaricola pyoseonensis TaxID=521013 RepID=A0A1G7AF17_9RHOB|nr:bifunctional 2-C-methyl-D-erythritol 4-phosphate cytidylyltransferase/2-C-methyl-D-erythritol 2,4-cyclodiphosphate synthase [Limimaricola pyoseonensis]SDE13047.1 2-C-methyl-D-erythritol 2,4-cyclodiphosphate synthase [Limimaricola pyoseonensis]